jgi:hypothetical protein
MNDTSTLNGSPHTAQSHYSTTSAKPKTGIMHEFMPGMTYQFGAIQASDVASHNWTNPTWAASKYPLIWDGSEFLAQGCQTVKDFLEKGVDEKGKPFPTTLKFLITVLLPPDNLPEYVHCGQFKAQSAQGQSSYSNGAQNGLHDGVARLSPHKLNKHAAQAQSETRFVVDEISRAARESRETLERQLTQTQKDLDAARKEVAELKGQNQVLSNENFLLKQSNEDYKRTIDAKLARLQEEFDRKKDDLKKEYDTLRKIETERNGFEREAMIAEAIEKAKRQWEIDLEKEDEGLADEIEDDLKYALRKDYYELQDRIRNFEIEQEKWEKKKKEDMTNLDRGVQMLGGLAGTPQGELVINNGLAMLAGFTDKIVNKFFASEAAVIKQQTAELKAAQQEAEERKAEQERQAAAQAAVPKEELTTSSDTKPENYQY